MKNIIMLLAFIFALSSMAHTTCFTSNTKVEYVDTPKAICVKDLKVALNADGENVLAANVNQDQLDLEIEKSTLIPGIGSRLKVKVLSFEEGLICDETVGFDIFMNIVVDLDGELIKIDDMTGHSFYTYDNCHSDRNYTDLNFTKF